MVLKRVHAILLLLYLAPRAMVQSQMACQCSEIARCMQEYDQQLLTAATNCRSQCQTTLGPDYGLNSINCFAEKEAGLVQIKNSLRTCFESKAGQPCVGTAPATATAPATPPPSTTTATTTNGNPIGGIPTSTVAQKRNKRALLQAAPPPPPPPLFIPPTVRNFILCYAGCQRSSFAAQVGLTQGRGGIYGYPGCARMLNCVLVKPSNFTGSLAAQVDCGMQAGIQTQLVYQTFCQCLKGALGAESQFLNCDVYGSPLTNVTLATPSLTELKKT